MAMAQRRFSRSRISHGIPLLVRCPSRLLILPPACQGILTLQWVTFVAPELTAGIKVSMRTPGSVHAANGWSG